MAGGASGLDVSDEEIASSFKEVMDDRSGKQWILLQYADSKKIQVGAQGSDGFEGLVTKFPTDDCAYGVCTAVPADGTEKRRFLICWAPEGAPVMRRAKMGIHKNAVINALPGIVGDVMVSDKEELLDKKGLVADISKAIGKELRIE